MRFFVKMIRIKAFKNPKNQFQDWIENPFTQKKDKKKAKTRIEDSFWNKKPNPTSQ
jgi:hypothetical protein